jgi:hypothetical protein
MTASTQTEEDTATDHFVKQLIADRREQFPSGRSFARACGLSRETIRRCECGESVPTYRTFTMILACLLSKPVAALQGWRRSDWDHLPQKRLIELWLAARGAVWRTRGLDLIPGMVAAPLVSPDDGPYPNKRDHNLQPARPGAGRTSPQDPTILTEGLVRLFFEYVPTGPEAPDNTSLRAFLERRIHKMLTEWDAHDG